MEAIDRLFSQLGLDKNALAQFKSLLKVKSLSPKEHWIAEGTICRYLGFVISGTIRSYVRGEDGEFNNDFYLPESFVSAYTSFLTQMPTNCNIQALAETKIAYISSEQFALLCEADARFFKLAKHISDQFFIRKCKRETSFLKHNATQRLLMVKKMYPGIEQQISQYHIASYLGIKPQSLSRIKLFTYVKD